MRGQAAVVLGGHDHNLQRHRPRDGLVQFVSGAGGRQFYPVERRHPGLAWGRGGAPGALRLDLQPGRAEAVFFTASGRRLDRSTVRCRP